MQELQVCRTSASLSAAVEDVSNQVQEKLAFEENQKGGEYPLWQELNNAVHGLLMLIYKFQVLMHEKKMDANSWQLLEIHLTTAVNNMDKQELWPASCLFTLVRDGARSRKLGRPLSVAANPLVVRVPNSKRTRTVHNRDEYAEMEKRAQRVVDALLKLA